MLKTLLTALILAVVVIIVSNCTSVAHSKDLDQPPRFTSTHDGDIEIVKDTATGCKYFRNDYNSGSGYTILLQSDGTPDCK